MLVNTTGQRYVVLDMLGAGTFGQVVSSYSEAEGRQVAVKVRGESAWCGHVWMWACALGQSAQQESAKTEKEGGRGEHGRTLCEHKASQ